ncbi:peroxiredoxin family protein [Maridesulfovibrio sp. FT414]|uniref:peroxiredoxin family protein n=1 Tax=Maridesulfovibrio sp. FT414 TaxID=2979469 RepID=UPI003D807EA0
MLKKILSVFIGIMLAASIASAAQLKQGDSFPDVELKGKLSAKQSTYLGIHGDGPWKLSAVDADYVLIEIYSMYCPHCQKEAPEANELYEKMLESGKFGKVKMIGIAAGNSEFETDFFRDKYSVEFPLFIDPELEIHAATGSTGTPHFYLVKLGSSNPVTVFSNEGRMKDLPAFLEKLKSAAGLN